MEVYINGIGNISPQKTTNPEVFLEEILEQTGNFFSIITPDYKEYIELMARRRMGRIIKAGVTAAKICLKDADLKMPGAIITGTGQGSVEDTEKFLSSILNNDEKLLNPANFMQSTYNTLSSQIAIQLDCHNYNNTYVHKAFSFESAIHDAMMLIAEKEADTVLAGGIDEITPSHYAITKRIGCWKEELINNLDLLKQNTPGTLPGEGATFFLLSATANEKTYARLQAIKTFYKPISLQAIEDHIRQFLQENDVQLADIDLVLLGLNGDNRFDDIYYEILNGYLTNLNYGYFKHLCGEYYTSTAFALWLASNIIKKQHLPSVVTLSAEEKKPIRNILIWNYHKNINHSLFLIKDH